MFDLFENLEKLGKLKTLATEREFMDVLKLDCAIIYFLVDWSGPERESRAVVYKTLTEIEKIGTLVFKIDCSDQKNQYIVGWLLKQGENNGESYYGGWGEMLLVGKGVVIDFIKNPGRIGLQVTKDKLIEWKNYCF